MKKVFFPDFYEIKPSMSLYVWYAENPDRGAYIMRRGDHWCVGVDENNTRLIAGIWKSNCSGVPEKLLAVDGQYAEHINQGLTNAEITDRVWSFISAKTITMDLVHCENQRLRLCT